jgi:hypothetical protein
MALIDLVRVIAVDIRIDVIWGERGDKEIPGKWKYQMI